MTMTTARHPPHRGRSRRPFLVMIPALLISALLSAILLPLLVARPATALHADEAGLTDFLLRTAGHGDVGVTYARLASTSHGVDPVGTDRRKVWVTSQSSTHPSSVVDDGPGATNNGGGSGGGGGDGPCSIAARDIGTGEVIWRVDACSSSGPDGVSTSNIDGGGSPFVPRHSTLASSAHPTVYSLDDAGIFRGYAAGDGQLALDVDLLASVDYSGSGDGGSAWKFPGAVPRLLDAGIAIGTVVSRENDDESLALIDAGTGQPIKEEGYHHQHSSASTSLLSARMLLQRAKVGPPRRMGGNGGWGRARIVDAHPLDEASGTIGIWAAWSGDDNGEEGDGRRRAVSSFSSMAFVEVSLTPKVSGGGGKDGPPVVTVYRIVRAAPLNAGTDAAQVANAPLLLSSLRMVRHRSDDDDTGVGVGKTLSMLAISSTSSRLLINVVDPAASRSMRGRVVEIDALHPYWRSIASIHVDSTDAAAVDLRTSLRAGSPFDVVRVAGIDDRYPMFPRRTEGLFLLNGGNAREDDDDDAAMFHRLYGPSKGDEDVHQDALAYCANMGVAVAASQDNAGGDTLASAFHIDPRLWQSARRMSWSPAALEGDVVIVPGGGRSSPRHGLVRHAHLTDCSDEGMAVVFTALGGTTSAFRLELKSQSMNVSRLWSSEEALGSVSSAVFLDETHALAPAAATESADEEEEKALLDLRFSSRIQSQLSSLSGFALGGGALSSLKSLVSPSSEGRKAERDVAFGFAKISVMLSERLHRIIALDTAQKGVVVWSASLHPRASWHRLVHGGQFSSLNDPHGNGGVHDHEMLALSYVRRDDDGGGIVEWRCLDATSGRYFSDGDIEVPGPVAQTVPMRGASHHHHDLGGCRQVALLVHGDRSVSVAPDTARSYMIIDDAISAAGPNGFFVHTVDEGTGEFAALRLLRRPGSGLEPGSEPFELVTVGTTMFDPAQERIINMAYPRRGEAVQSPSTVLGDDALLLKYLNPHLVVVVTEATPKFLSSVAAEDRDGEKMGDGFYDALVGGGQYSGTTASAGQKRKPLGASKPGAVVEQTSAIEPTPSLFVSLVDSVSGQILHRVSHAHVLDPESAEAGEGTTRVPVVVSENWVVYAFSNRRTRRTDVGVLTLHEGMIDKNGLTAFSAPEQELEFSSLESAKPIVLSRTYGMAKPVTALGVTMTRAGISSRQFLFATGNDQVVSMDRRILDPRRPNGELKESEKMEGLVRYSPLLPVIPLKTTSHVYEVSSVQSILSASANVESQSLVLAYGGPDVFFSRVAPSKGFDLLPDDFNRGLLMAVLVGLIVLLNVIQRMNKKKMVSTVWS